MIAACYRTLLLLITTKYVMAVPEPMTCVSYMEEDKYIDDEFEHNLYDGTVEVIITELNSDLQVPQNVICSADYSYCFSLWQQIGNKSHFIKQGCWKESTDRNASCSQSTCTSSSPTLGNSSIYYCCCSGALCNRKVSATQPTILQLSKELPRELSEGTHKSSTTWIMIFLYSLSLIAFVLLSIMYLYYRNKKVNSMPEEAPLALCGPGYSSNLRNVDNINLIDLLGNGKYSVVMKGLLHGQEVAVKIIPNNNYEYFVNERNIYSLPFMESPSLLQYFGHDERHTLDGNTEHLLILSLASLGCLQDWLAANTASFDTYCNMVKSITRGLSHLHTEFRNGDESKPCIVHRDLNSRNILVKADYTCCIADFGFALKVHGSRYEYKGEIASAEAKSINEVGTLRYMAPEMLEGAVNLRDCETSLKQMDVYALGLVLWELATRCYELFEETTEPLPPYKQPYEVEVGAHPTCDQMQALVVHKKARPKFPDSWDALNPVIKMIKDTCEDCWDHDAEARLTSVCAEQRMNEVAGLQSRLKIRYRSPPANGSVSNVTATNNDPTAVNNIKQSPDAMAKRRDNNEFRQEHASDPCKYETALNHFISNCKSKMLPSILRDNKSADDELYRESNSYKQMQTFVKKKSLNDDHSESCRHLSTQTNNGNDILTAVSASKETNIRNGGNNSAFIHRPKNLDLSPISPYCKDDDRTISRDLFKEYDKSHNTTNARDSHRNMKKMSSVRSNGIELSLPDPCSTISPNTNPLESVEMRSSRLDKPAPAPNAQDDVELLQRQRSHEVIRGIFRSGENDEKLLNPCQRVKTPGDLPASVRKLRAWKRLSLLDDRMMDTSTFNIL